MDLMDALEKTNAIEKELIECGGEISAELEIKLTELNLDYAESIDATAIMLRRLEGASDYWRERAQNAANVASGLTKAHERLKSHVKQIMSMSEKHELVGRETRYVLSRAKPRLVIDENLLPKEFLAEKITLIPDKANIEKRLELGHEIAGARFEQSYALRTYPVKLEQSE